MGQDSTVTASVKLYIAYTRCLAYASRQNTDFRHWRRGTIQSTLVVARQGATDRSHLTSYGHKLELYVEEV